MSTKGTFAAGVDDPQFRSGLLNGALSREAASILKSAYRCDPPVGEPEEPTVEFFSEKGLVLWTVDLKPPKPVHGHGPQISCTSDCEQVVLFESGELAIVRTRHYSGYNNVYTYGVGEYIEETKADRKPLTEAEFKNQRARICDELWRRVCAVGEGENETREDEE